MPLEWTWDQSLSALLLPLLLYATYALRESDSKLRCTGYGLLWAFAALTNPSLCTLLPFLLGWIVFERRKSARPTFALVARTAVFFALGLLPWTARNYWALDGFVPVKSNFGLELWLGNNPAVDHIYAPSLHPWSSLNQTISLAINGEVNYNRKAARSALNFIKTHPGRFLQLSYERFVDTWTNEYDVTMDPWPRLFHVERGYVVFCCGFSLLALAGLLLAAYKYRSDAVPLALTVLIFPATYYVTHTAARYRHPIDPVMCILSVFAMTRVLSAVSVKFLRRSEIVAATLEPQAATTSRV